jgi:hypothetical protein
MAAEADSAYLYVDGYDRGEISTGVVEAFLGSAECFLAEGGTPAAFDGRGTDSAVMTGTTVLDCYDPSSDTAGTAQVTVDLAWTASAAPVTNRFTSRQTGCTSVRSTAAATVTGSVRVVARAFDVDVVLVPQPERPAEVARQTDRCRQPGR